MPISTQFTYSNASPNFNVATKEPIVTNEFRFEQRRQYLSVANRNGQLSLKDQIAFMAGRDPIPETDNLFLKMLNRLRAPQSGLFTTMRGLKLGEDPLQAVYDGMHEMTSGLYHGNLPRDVQFSDVLFPENERRTIGQAVLGFAGDLVVDPLIIASKFRLGSTVFSGGKKFSAWSYQKVADTRLGEAAISKTKPVVDTWKRWFIEEVMESPGGVAVSEGSKKLKNFLNLNQGRLIDEAVGSSRLIRKFADESKLSYEDANKLLTTHLDKTTVDVDKMVGFATKDGPVYMSKREAREAISDQSSALHSMEFVDAGRMEDRLALELTSAGLMSLEYGFSTLRQEGVKLSNFRKIISNSRPIRRSFFKKNFDETSAALGLQLPEKLRKIKIGDASIESFVVEYQDKQLNKLVDKAWNSIKKGQGAGDVTAIGAPISAAMHGEHFSLALSKKAKRLIKGTVYGNSQKWGFKLDTEAIYDLRQQVSKKGLIELNDEFLAGELKLKQSGVLQKVPNPNGIDLFDMDVSLIDTVRTYYAEKFIATVNTLDTFVDEYGINVLTDPEILHSAKGVRNTESIRKILTARGDDFGDYVPLQLKDSAGKKPWANMWVPKEANDHLVKAFDTAKDKGALEEFFGVFTSMHSFWKAWTIMPFSEYHFRNVIGNQWNKYLGGMGPKSVQHGHYVNWLYSDIAPEAVKNRVTDLARRGIDVPLKGVASLTTAKIAGDTITLGGNNYKRGELLDLIDTMGIVRSGQFGMGELKQSFEGAIQLGQKGFWASLINPRVDVNPFIRGGIKIGGNLEDWDRTHMFLWALDQMGSVKSAKKLGLGDELLRINSLGPTKAATAKKLEQKARLARDYTLKYLFDYDALTDVEKKVFRGVLAPFYAWTRKNIPLQIEHLVREPQKFTTLLKTKNLVEADYRSGDAGDDKFVAQFLREGLSIRVKENAKGEMHYFLLNNWIPSADLAELDSTEEIIKFTVNMLGPGFKEPMQQAFKESLFFEREFDVAHNKFVGIRMPDRAASILRNARILTLADRLMRMEDKEAVEFSGVLTRSLTGINVVKQVPNITKRTYFSKVREAEIKLKRAIGRVRRESPGILEDAGITSPELNRLQNLLKQLEAGQVHPEDIL